MHIKYKNSTHCTAFGVRAPLTLTEQSEFANTFPEVPLKCEGAYGKTKSFHQFIQQILLQGFSCYAPLNWQWLPCFTWQPSSPPRQSVQRLWKSRSSSTAPSRSHVHGAEAAIPLLLPRLCWFVFICIACSRLGVCFLVFGGGKVGKGKYL